MSVPRLRRQPMLPGLLALLAVLRPCPAAAFDVTNASLDELFFHAQRSAATNERQTDKDRARDELFRRGPEALDYLVGHAGVTNMWYWILSERLVKKLEAEEAVPVLLRHVDADHERVRKAAAFFLGFYEAPEHAQRLYPLLEHDKTMGAAVRTLGKWGTPEALPHVIPVLRDGKERRRTLAANALRDIGDPAAIPHLVAALGDPFFTVRKTAARALVSFGKQAEPALLAALPAAERTAQREIIHVLGRLDSRRSRRALRRLRRDPDPFVRADVERAMQD